MDDFNYQLNEVAESDAVQQWRNDFVGDVDRVLFEGHDLLSSMSCASNQDAPSSFLNPITDMLTDVNFCEQIGIGSTQSMSVPQTSAPQLNSWGVHENVDVSNLPAFINLGDHLKSTDICDSNNISSTYNSQSLANDNTDLLPEPNVEFPAVDCAFFGGDYSSTISQWLQSIEQQQFPQSHTQISQSLLQTSQGYPDTLLNTIGSLPASTTITPVPITDDNMVRSCQSIAQSTVENDVTIEPSFIPNNSEVFVPSTKNSMFFTKDEKSDLIVGNFENNFIDFQQNRSVKRKAFLNVDKNEWCPQLSNVIPQSITQQLTQPINTTDVFQKSLETFANQTNLQQTSLIPFAARQATDVCNQNKHISHSPMFPRKHTIQPPEMIIMHPLRTRKLLSSRRPVGGSAGDSNSVLNLAEYFDTSCINIPMIRERTRTEIRNETRRKQKLHIIPGSEQLVFEVQKRPSTEKLALSPNSLNEKVSPETDPYPETELPELDEIFKRKKKNAPTNTATSKKLNALPVLIGAIVEPTTKNSNENNVINQQQSSTSFEEKVSVSSVVNRNSRRNLSIDKQDLIYNSDSDSIESVIEKIEEGTNIIRSFKCQRCKKFFKTTRSLAIHTKRCTSIKADSDTTSSCSEITDGCTSLTKNKLMYPQVLIKPIRIQQNEFVENNEPEYSDDNKSSPLHTITDFHKPRPRTRSQTRSSGQSSSSFITGKRSK